MTVGKRVSKAFKEMMADDFESALLHICAPIEATAQAEGFAKGKGGYKAWIKANIPIITGISVEPAKGIVFRSDKPILEYTKDDWIGIEEYLYHIVRCNLYHTTGLTGKCIIGERIGAADGQFYIPKGFVIGMVVAVAASPANASSIADDDYFFNVAGKQLLLSECWGKRDELLLAIKDAHASNKRRKFLSG